MDYSLLYASIHKRTGSEPCKFRPLNPCKSSMDSLSILEKSTLRGVPAQGEILGHTARCGPGELNGSHLWIAIYSNLR